MAPTSGHKGCYFGVHLTYQKVMTLTRMGMPRTPIHQAMRVHPVSIKQGRADGAVASPDPLPADDITFDTE
jgi:hypothetical protein